MHDDFSSLPFYVNGTWVKSFGILRLEPQVLVVEFQQFDRLTHLYRSRIRTIQVPYLSIQAAELATTWQGRGVLTLKAHSLYPFRHIPGALQGHCWLRTQRAQRQQARGFNEQLQIKLSEQHLEHLYQQELYPNEANFAGHLDEAWHQRLARLLSRN